MVAFVLVSVVLAWWLLALEPREDASAGAHTTAPIDIATIAKEERQRRRLERVIRQDAPAAPSPPAARRADPTVAILEGQVLESDGRPAVHGSVVVEGVKGSLKAVGINNEGTYRVALPPDRYWVHASRWDGPIQVRSGVESRRLAGGERVVMNFELPAEYSGEPGFVAAMASDGFEIKWVLSGSSAKTLGLQKGDVILAVDGTATTDLSEEAFERMLVGPEGTDVSLHVRFFDAEGAWEDTVTLQRSGMDGLLEP